MKRNMLWLAVTAIGLAALLGIAYGLDYRPFLPEHRARADAAVVVGADQSITAPATPSFAGALQPGAAVETVIADAKVVPVVSADLGFAANGIVTELTIREGSVVTAGQRLVQLDTRDALVAVAQAQANLLNAKARYEELQAGAQREDVEAAQAALAAAQARLDKLTLSTEHGDIAAAQATVNQAQANLQQVLDGSSEQQLIEARANLFNAEAELQRAQSAYNGVRWRNDVGATRESAELQTATNNYEAAQARLTDLENGATQAQIAGASAQVQGAQAQLHALQSSRPADLVVYQADVRSAQAQLDKLLSGTRPEQLTQAEANVAAATAALQQQLVALSKLELQAPFSGTVAALEVALGEQVIPGAPVLRLADLSQLQVETEDLTELQVVYIQEGDHAQVTFDALPALTVDATVVAIRPYGENSSGDIVYRATLALAQPDPRLRWNMTAAVTLTQAGR